MKLTAIILAVLCIAGLMVVGYLWLSSDIGIRYERVADAHGISGVSAAERPDLFASVRDAVEAGGRTLEDPSAYVFYTWRITVSNNTRVPMDTLEVAVVNERTKGVVALIQTKESLDLPAHKTCEVEFTVLAESNASPELPVRVTWYLWGQKNERSVVMR